MGRSSILLISLALSLDYGLSIYTYYEMAYSTMNITICRLADRDDKWFDMDWDQVDQYLFYIIPAFTLILSLPMALYTTVHHLKYLARCLFILNCLVVCLTVPYIFVEPNTNKELNDMRMDCIKNIF